jgi:hypothetical protein
MRERPAAAAREMPRGRVNVEFAAYGAANSTFMADERPTDPRRRSSAHPLSLPFVNRATPTCGRYEPDRAAACSAALGQSIVTRSGRPGSTATGTRAPTWASVSA